MSRFLRRVYLPAVLVSIAALVATGVAVADHKRYDYSGDPQRVEWFMGTGDPDDDSHIHSFTQINGHEEGNGCRRDCIDDMAVEIRRADKRYANAYQAGPYADCHGCEHVHAGLNTKYRECHYYSKHWGLFGDRVTFHHYWCGEIRG
jgi:hypothetical protein